MPYDLGGVALPAAPVRSCPTPSSTSCAATTRSSSARSAPPRSRPACSSAACSSSCASSSTSSSTCARSPRRRARSTTASTWSSSARTPKAPTRARAGSCATAPRSRSRPRVRSTPASASSGASASRSSSPSRGPRRHLTLVHKTNVLTFAGDLWQRAFNEVATEYPDVTTGYDHIDAACIHFVQRPERYDVIVTDNLFGDILTDLGGAIAGGHRARGVGQPQPGPHRAVAVRAGPRLGARTSRAPATADPRAAIISAGDAARVPRRGRGGGAGQEGSRGFRRCIGIHIGDRHTDRGKGLGMPIEKTEKIWMDGELVPWDEAKHPRPHATRSTTGWASSRASARTRRARARRSSGSPSTSSGCSTPPRS